MNYKDRQSRQFKMHKRLRTRISNYNERLAFGNECIETLKHELCRDIFTILEVETPSNP